MSPEPELPGFYQRPGLNVETYDARTERLLASSPVGKDIELFVELARQTGGPVLDLGCGTGRVSWVLAEAGLSVVGVDTSQPMLQRAEVKRSSAGRSACGLARFALGDMSDFALQERFALALSAFRAFQSVPTAAEQRRCLERVFHHLKPGGMLVLDLFDPRLDWCAPGGGELRGEGSVIHPVTGNLVETDVVERQTDPLTQRLEEVWQFTERDLDGTVLRQERELLRLRWSYRWEMRYLLELTGFEIAAEYSDFKKSPPAYGKEQIWVARRSEMGG